MPELTDFAALIFDMDGLVLDTEPTYCAAWLQAIETMGLKIYPNAFNALSGHHYRQVEAQLIDWYGEDFNLPEFRQISGEQWRHFVRANGIAIKSGVLELIDYTEQNQLPIALATNSSAINAFECLYLTGIKHKFPVIVTGDDVQRVKPEPDIFLTAAERLHVDIKNCLVLEDSYTGIMAAAAAGACTVYIPSRLPANPHAVKLATITLNDMLHIFDNLPLLALNGI